MQRICDGEIPTSKLFTNWEKSGKINKLTDKQVDLSLYNSLSTYLEHNTYKSIQHFYPSGVEVLRNLCRQCHGNRKEIKDELYGSFQTLTIGPKETATNFAQKVIGRANKIRSMGKEMSRKELRQRIIKGIFSYN